ncbi:MAG: insulinase family protein [Clostridia bacterium]|nr:insulinase family protein [Clostridia bacterium]
MQGYTLNEKRYIRDLKCEAAVYVHDKTGARVVVLPVDDDNRAISIAFSTPSENSTGMAHIIEHSVLCGSEKYPLKDPFVQLMKGSMYSFLNAMTASDFTVYPVASTNEKDFRNLADVYLDAVFNPLLPNKKEIFLQEGKHYLLDEEKREATAFNGVVFNEMRGASSSPDYYLERAVYGTLYENTPYEHESGGDPLAIADLTFDALRDFYLRHYTASNSIIFLYGKIDFDEMLGYISENYLNKYPKTERYSVGEMPSQNSKKELTLDYPADETDMENGWYFALNFALHHSHSPLFSLTLRILERILSSSQGALIKNELQKKGIGEDFYSYVDEGTKLPMFNFTAARCSENDGEEFKNTVLSVIKNLAENGIDKEKLRSALRMLEFQERENADGWLPKGIEYGFQMLPKFLYDEDDKLLMLEFFDAIDELKKKVETDYFEQFLREYFLKNEHCSFITLRPDSHYSEKVDSLLNEKCKKNSENYSFEELKADLELLDNYRQSEDTKPMQEKIPILERGDLSSKVDVKRSETVEFDGGTLIFQKQSTNSIAYFDFLFDLRCLTAEERKYYRIFTEIFGAMDTAKYDYATLSDLIDSYTGGISHTLHISDGGLFNKPVVAYLDWHTRFLYENKDRVFDINREILENTDFSDTSRIRDLLLQLKSSYIRELTESSQSYARRLGLSAYSEAYALEDELIGYGFYKFLCELLSDFDNRKQKLIEMMNSIREKLLNRRLWKFAYVGEEEFLEDAKKYAGDFSALLKNDGDCEFFALPNLSERKNVALSSPGQIQYNAVCGLLPEEEKNYRGNLLVLNQFLNTDYLWHGIRVLGGAYGCFSYIDYTGEVCIVSYRDPKLKETLDYYKTIADYIEKLDIDERQVRQFVIGAMSKLERPKMPYTKGILEIFNELCGVLPELSEKNREQLINTSLEDLKKLAPLFRQWLDNSKYTVIGNEQMIRESENIFDEVSPLL